MRYRFEGKGKTLAIGPYPQISLTEAKAKQSDAKMKLLAGIYPTEQKQAIKKKEKETALSSESGTRINLRLGRKDMLTR